MTLGIDLDTKRVTLAYRANKLWRVVTVPTKHDIVDAQALSHALDAARDAGATVAYIERPWLGVNPRTHGRLSEVYGAVACLCAFADIEPKPVASKSWQTAMLNCGARAKRDELKRASMLRAAAEGAAPKNDHEADAVCIAVWGQANEFGEMVG